MGKTLEDLKASYEAIGPIYPIITDKQGNPIDGFHRTKIDPNWPKIAIEADEVKKAIIALVANTTRRKPGKKEIGDKLGKLKELTSWSIREISQKTGIPESTIYKNIPQKHKDKLKSEQIKTGIKRISNCIDSTNSDSENNNEESITSEEQKQLEPQLFIKNVWVAADKRPKGAGNPNFQGNTPPIVAEQCILKYSKEGDTVLDPMAGSGTLIDLCKKYSRKIEAFDIKPMRDDIKKADAEWLDSTHESIDFIFAHWPYWNMVPYSSEKDDLSNLNFQNFLEKTDKIFDEIKRILKPNAFFAVLIGDRRKNKQIYDLSAELSKIGSKNFMLFDKIVWLGKGQASLTGVDGGISVWRAKTYGFHLLSFDTLLVFKKVDGNG